MVKYMMFFWIKLRKFDYLLFSKEWRFNWEKDAMAFQRNNFFLEFAPFNAYTKN